MAIINSVVVGRGKKSVGEVTLAYQRGRTIARRRVFENKSRTSLQTVQRDKFKTIVRLVAPYKNFFCSSFEKTQYGSQYNAFIKRTAERWLSTEFQQMVEKTGFVNVNLDTANKFVSVIDVLTNAVTVQTQAEYGDGLPYVGYGSITPISYETKEIEQRQNTAESIKLTVALEDGKGWAMDVIGYVVDGYNSNFEDAEGVFYQKTYNLYSLKSTPYLLLGSIDQTTGTEVLVDTDEDSGIVTFDINAIRLLIDLVGGADKIGGQTGKRGIMNVSIRKYQKYIKNTMYLLGNARTAEV